MIIPLVPRPTKFIRLSILEKRSIRPRPPFPRNRREEENNLLNESTTKTAIFSVETHYFSADNKKQEQLSLLRRSSRPNNDKTDYISETLQARENVVRWASIR